MTDSFDLVIRNGLIVDGSGGAAYQGDVAVTDGRIAQVGTVAGRGHEEIDAAGRVVTPGFVDIHTHYDGQVTWEHTLSPSSNHGVTTVVTGNCGVGFAPVRPGDHETLIKVMEGVEDIPELVMAEGIPWNWETFPEYMEALAARPFDIDVAVQVPHSPIRVYVMGERGARHDASTAEDRTQMTAIVSEAIRAGAIGVSTSRSSGHRLKNGELAPSVTTEQDELLALAQGLREVGAGVFQLITDASADPAEELEVVTSIARAAQRPTSYTLLQAPRWPDKWRTMLALTEQANAEGLELRGQVFPRPVGVLMGLDLSLHRFAYRPSYRAVADLPLAERVERLRDPAVKAAILSEQPIDDPQPLNNMMVNAIDEMFELTDPVDYAPRRENSLVERAKAAGRDPDEYIYDVLLKDEGRNIVYLPGANFVGCSLDAAREMMDSDYTVLGLGDGGAHYGFICDASFPTFALTHWVRDAAPGQGFPLERMVAELTSRPARAVRLGDRGLIAPGMRADLNVIDMDALTLYAPRTVHDLPAGGRRLRQDAKGYVATVVAGEITYRDGAATGTLPGRLVRGEGWHAPVPESALPA
ncbi:MAG: amidohydrolase family protein [Novosphingobium sp.]